jgi:hypothetical protein
MPATPALIIAYPAANKDKKLSALKQRKLKGKRMLEKQGLRFGGRSIRYNGIRVSYGSDMQKG